MPETETARQLRIKTGSVKRLHKELGMYSQELERETARVEKMKADGVDEYDVKQAEQVKTESAMMIPDCRQRLESALSELHTAVEDAKRDAKRAAHRGGGRQAGR